MGPRGAAAHRAGGREPVTALSAGPQRLAHTPRPLDSIVEALNCDMISRNASDALVEGVPFLFFLAGLYANYHTPLDEAGRVDADRAARVAVL